MLPNVYLNADEFLDDKTILGSYRTCRQLRSLLGETEFDIQHSEVHSDDVITVSPELYDAFHYYLEYLEKNALLN